MKGNDKMKNICVITGASSGIGKEFFVSIAKDKDFSFDEFWVIARNEDRLKELGALCDIAAEKGLLESNSVVYRDLFDTMLMGLVTPRPSEVIRVFRAYYEVSPKLATDYFYDLCRNSDYIRTYRVKKDLKWTYNGKYGEQQSG